MSEDVRDIAALTEEEFDLLELRHFADGEDCAEACWRSHLWLIGPNVEGCATCAAIVVERDRRGPRTDADEA